MDQESALQDGGPASGTYEGSLFWCGPRSLDDLATGDEACPIPLAFRKGIKTWLGRGVLTGPSVLDVAGGLTEKALPPYQSSLWLLVSALNAPYYFSIYGFNAKLPRVAWQSEMADLYIEYINKNNK